MRKSSQNIVVGKTISQKRRTQKEELSLDTERDKLRKKSKKRTVFSVIFILMLVVALTMLCGMAVKSWLEASEETDVFVVEEKYEPTVQILDENGNNGISERVKEYVGQLESDLDDFGLKMARAVLPIGKMREIDIHIEGIVPYFKVNIDRETSVSVEDIVRMIRYMKEKEIAIDEMAYIDVRVEGKAYYK